jgi:hypothetical protein
VTPEVLRRKLTYLRQLLSDLAPLRFVALFEARLDDAGTS